MHRAVVVLISFAFLAMTFSGCLDLGTGSTYYSYPETIGYTFINEIELEVTEGQVDYTLSVPFPSFIGPVDDPIQSISSWNATSGGSLRPYSDSQRMEWNGTSDSTISARYRVTVTSRTVKWMESSAKSGYPSDVPSSVSDTYPSNRDEWLIRPTDPTISQLASTLVTEDMTVSQGARSILDYITDKIEYQTLDGGKPKDCVRTLEDGAGDCDDQSILFCSIARAAGIPAWLEFGYLYDRSSGDLGPHGWVAMYVPLGSGGGGKVNIDVVNDEFMLRTSAHITTWEDTTGDEQMFRDYYNVTVYSGFPPFRVQVRNTQSLLSVDPSDRDVIVTVAEGDSFIPLPLIVAPAVLVVVAGLLYYSKRR